jgi:hypothetical protein
MLSTDGTGVLQWTSPSTGWSLTGNASTNPATNFLGTTDAQDLVIRTSNTSRLRVTSSGNVLINQATALSTLTPSLEISGNGNANPWGQPALSVYANHGTQGAWNGYLMFNKSRGITEGSLTAVASGDRLGTIRYNGADGVGGNLCGSGRGDGSE